MGADRGIKLWVGGAKNDRHGSSGGQSGHEDATLIDLIVRRDLASDTGNEQRLAAVATLIFRSEPVPALRSVRIGRLGGIDHQKAVLLCKHIHARAGSEVIGRLRA